PAPNTVARPTTLGACQVRLQLSMLLERSATLENFCAAKLSSLVVFEQLKTPVIFPASIAARKPAVARSSASAQLATLSSPPSRTSGCVSLAELVDMFTSLDAYSLGRDRARRVRAEPGRRPSPEDVLLGLRPFVAA